MSFPVKSDHPYTSHLHFHFIFDILHVFPHVLEVLAADGEEFYEDEKTDGSCDEAQGDVLD